VHKGGIPVEKSDTLDGHLCCYVSREATILSRGK
jgi:hypothetical protein